MWLLLRNVSVDLYDTQLNYASIDVATYSEDIKPPQDTGQTPVQAVVIKWFRKNNKELQLFV